MSVAARQFEPSARVVIRSWDDIEPLPAVIIQRDECVYCACGACQYLVETPGRQRLLVCETAIASVH